MSHEALPRPQQLLASALAPPQQPLASLVCPLASVSPASITLLSSQLCPGLQSLCPQGSLPSLDCLASLPAYPGSNSQGSILSILGSSTETDSPEVSDFCLLSLSPG